MIESDGKLGKPVSSTNDHIYHKGSVMRRGSFHKETNDQNQIFKFIPDGEEYLKLKMLSKITLEPITMLKSREKNAIDQ